MFGCGSDENYCHRRFRWSNDETTHSLCLRPTMTKIWKEVVTQRGYLGLQAASTGGGFLLHVHPELKNIAKNVIKLILMYVQNAQINVVLESLGFRGTNTEFADGSLLVKEWRWHETSVGAAGTVVWVAQISGNMPQALDCEVLGEGCRKSLPGSLMELTQEKNSSFQSGKPRRAWQPFQPCFQYFNL